MSNRMERPVRCIETGEIYPSIHAASRAHGICVSNLCAYLKYGMTGERGGYHWELAPMPPRQVIQCKETKEIFLTAEEAAKKFKLAPATIRLALRLNRPTRDGFSFCWVVKEG